MNIPNDLKIIPLDLIPKGQECSFDNLPELYKLGLLMQAICDKENGIGISAVQMGIPFNFFVINYGQKNYHFFANCTYVPVSEEKEKYIESCLSIREPNGKFRHFEVERFKNILIKGKELLSSPILQVKDFEFIPTDYYKIVFQHEIDHNFKITIDQIGKEVFLWNK